MEYQVSRNECVRKLNFNGNCQKINNLSWKKYWDNQSSKYWPKMCRMKGCENETECGTRVEVDEMEGEYILPTCLPCNQSTDDDEWQSLKSKSFVVQIPQYHQPSNRFLNSCRYHSDGGDENSDDYSSDDDDDESSDDYDDESSDDDEYESSEDDNDESSECDSSDDDSREYELSKNQLVRNLKGTSNLRKIGGRTWKAYWERYSTEQWPKMCRVKFCKNETEGGAHVEVEGMNGVFILPTCLPCNQSREGWMPVKADAVIVKVVYKYNNTHYDISHYMQQLRIL